MKQNRGIPVHRKDLTEEPQCPVKYHPTFLMSKWKAPNSWEKEEGPKCIFEKLLYTQLPNQWFSATKKKRKSNFIE